MNLTKEEKDIIESLERGEWKSVPNLEQEKARYQAIAQASLRKDKRVTVRMTSRDMRRLEVKATEEGLTHQALISSVLHKYINGTLKG